MTWRVVLTGVPGLLFSPAQVLAAANIPAGGHPLHVPIWTVAPFVGLLLAIAILPLVAEHFWHNNRNRALVSGLFALPVIVYLVLQGAAGVHALEHALIEYIDFIILLWSLYTISGGIALHLNVKPTPLVNGILLSIGAVLANLIGTTGASMLLIRPYLRINHSREHKAHLPVFFLFMVSNLGGLLTPLGDPPLFLGFLRGVDFFWTMQLWPEWLAANAIVLMIFLVWDTVAATRERDPRAFIEQGQPPEAATNAFTFGVEGLINLFFLGGVIGAVLLQSAAVAAPVTAWVRQFYAGVPDLMLGGLITDWLAQHVPGIPQMGIKWSVGVMVLMGVLSLLLSPRSARQANGFTWAAIVEVAVLFIGIFITMVPALELLKIHGKDFGLTEPWQYFWLTGSLSSFLDNAPTYLSFATLAAGDHPLSWLMTHQHAPGARPGLILAAISCGAVFMGAMTYIGNGPNFMVKAIADEAGYQTPSFFGYLVYSVLILVPVFVMVMFLEFTPNLNW